MLQRHALRRTGPGWDALAVDGALAAAAATLASISLHYHRATTSTFDGDPGPSQIGSYVLLVTFCSLVAVRRAWPTTSFLAVVGLFGLLRVLDVPEPTVTVMVLAGSYVSVGVHGAPRGRTPARIVATIGFVALYIVEAIQLATDQNLDESFRSLLVFDITFSVAIIGSAWFTGDVVRGRMEAAHALAERTEELEIERDRTARLAITNERLRIARELHDVLAHHVSVMGLQAVAADRVIDRNPADARAALHVIERSSRAAVEEMRQLIGFLRADDDVANESPQPNLTRFRELIETGASLGLDVDWKVAGDPYPLPAGIDLAGYRIVQEAITNAYRHSTASAVQVTLHYRPGRLTVTVTDNGSPRARPLDAHGIGMGLIGMRERVRLHEGTIEIDQGDGGGYRIVAMFPVRQDQ
jgi:signal transduction histidine kinase